MRRGKNVAKTAGNATAPLPEEDKELSTHLREDYETPLGFEDGEESDLIVPRVKVIQTLSPERKEKIAEEGEIINSLTHEKLNGKTFIPVFMFHNNIWWKDRKDGGGINCIARDGKCGVPTDGSPSLICTQCRANEFDNTKTGAAAQPKCTKYINFFGFFEGEAAPIILSFSKTNYSEGKKMYSLAKVTMQNMWNYGYRLVEKKKTKGNNEWFIIDPIPSGATNDDNRAHGLAMFKMFRNVADIKFDMESATESTEATAGPSMATDAEVKDAEF